MHVSVIIPAYNEAGRIRDTLEHVTAYLSRQEYDSEVIVVDDGSSDGTAASAKRSFPDTKTVSYQPNRGKGYAVRTGMLAASGAYRLFYDADGSTPIDELEQVWPHFQDGADIVIGSRALPDSNVEIPQSWARRNMGRMFNILVKSLAFRGIPDTQCGFKIFTAAACETVCSRQTLDGFAFDVELLYIAKKHALRIDQIPVRWVNSPRSAVSLLRAPAHMLHEVLKIRANDRQGRYE